MRQDGARMTSPSAFEREIDADNRPGIDQPPMRPEDRRAVPRGVEPDRRDHPRFTVVWTGRIQIAPKPVECVILNISAAGAKLRVFAHVDLPADFNLTVDRFGEFPATLVWSDGRSAGVNFVGDPKRISEIFATALPTAKLTADRIVLPTKERSRSSP